MIKLDRSSKRKVEGQTILILVECLKGALKAGRFVLNHLYTDKDRVILLQVYKVKRQGLFLMRNISKILKDVSIDELTILKNKLIEEFNISPFRIQKMSIEGELAATLKRKFCKGDNPIVVIGEDTQFYQHEIPQKQISTIMKGTCIKNIFYIDNNITLIDDSRILNISGSPEEITEISKNYLVKLSKKYNLEIEYVSPKRKHSALITNMDMSNKESSYYHPHKAIINILNERSIKSNVGNEID